MDDFQQESWVSLYQAVLMELEHEKMLGRIADAGTAIVARSETLRDLPGLHAQERRAIEDAVRTLGFLEREEERYQSRRKMPRGSGDRRKTAP